MIDPRQLANLLAVATHGSFNRAATARGISQPALSNSIAQLERRLGVKVLERTRRGSELTAIGQILVRSAQVLETLLVQTSEQVRLQRLGIVGPLRIGVSPSLLLKFMPDLVAQLHRRQPALSLSVVEGLDDQLLPALQTGELDLVLGPVSGLFGTPADITEQALFEDPFSIGVSADHALSQRSSLTLAELRDAAWVVPRAGSAYRRHVESLFTAAGLPWPINVIETSSLTLVECIVAQTDRVTLITELQAAMHNTWHIRAIPLSNAGRRILGVKWRSGMQPSPLAEQVIQVAHELAKRYRTARLTPR